MLAKVASSLGIIAYAMGGLGERHPKARSIVNSFNKCHGCEQTYQVYAYPTKKSAMLREPFICFSCASKCVARVLLGDWEDSL